MENASKALIIAGAILLAILLISLGILVYNQAKGTVSDADMSAEEVQTFNTKFTTYGGDINGTKANALLDAVIASNAKNPNHIIEVNSADATSAARYNKDDRVNVTFEYDEGYVSNVIIN